MATKKVIKGPGAKRAAVKKVVKKTATKTKTVAKSTTKKTIKKVNKTISKAKETREAKKAQSELVRKTWARVQLSRHKDRPTSLEYIHAMFDDFIELHGDRNFADDKAIVGGLAWLDGMPVTVIGQQKGRDTEENIKRRFGMPNPDGYRKSLRLMKQAEKFKRPIVTFIDTPGAYPGLAGEERGQGEAIARNLMEMAQLETPVIAIIIGEGGSGGALALAVANEVWMLENSFYSILSPEGFSSILWKSNKKAPEAAAVMKSTAQNLKKFGIIDKIVKEPKGGAHLNPSKTFLNVKSELIIALRKLNRVSRSSLVKKRNQKFREMGSFKEGN